MQVSKKKAFTVKNDSRFLPVKLKREFHVKFKYETMQMIIPAPLYGTLIMTKLDKNQ